eukprot:TRINITY_DN29253_c0_g1_i1.p1 TRINITY_DN29253_c0_g1~~TRINITY_DN29253_c0_g1_i1.p1  ORF type:complete len:498 (-),score=99.53 TRINITY_DN29253_c0_g1_i1:16-1488(-)
MTRAAEKAMQEASGLLAQCLEPEELAATACAAHSWGEAAAAVDWASRCEADFGAVCTQYLQYMELLDERRDAGWRPLCLRLRSFHHELRRGRWCGEGPWAGAQVLPLQGSPLLLQGGHSVIFCGNAECVLALPMAAGSECARAFRPAEFLDVVPIAAGEVVGVSLDLRLERWRLAAEKEGDATLLCHAISGLEPEEGSRDASCVFEGLRLFVEHVARRIFLFAGRRILAFDMASLEQLYALLVPIAETEKVSRCDDVEATLARWDYGRSFLAYQQEGYRVGVWSTLNGASLGQVKSHHQLLCCDVTHIANDAERPEVSSRKSSCALLATLEVDGHIRLFIEEAGGDWQQVAVVGTASLVVEVKLERSLLLAVSHLDDSSSGTVHVWDVSCGGIDNHRARDFDRAPDRVEARHGGHFVEVCFVPEGPEDAWPVGVFDVLWLDPKDQGLRQLLSLKAAIGDWRCDLRDALARLGAASSEVQWLPLWPPLPAG